MPDAVTVARSWCAMHAVGAAAIVWVAALPVVVLTARSSLTPLLAPPRSGSVPTVLLIPLLAAGGAVFALRHTAPQLLGTRTRSLAVPQLLWSLSCLLPGAALAALGAVRAEQVTVLASQRNALLLTGVAVLASLVLPVGLSPLLPLLYEVVCMEYAAAANAGFPVPGFVVLLDHTATGPQLAVAAAVCGGALVLHHLVRDRRHG